MLGSLDRWLRRRSVPWIGGASGLLVAFVGALDFSSGYELGFSIFYVLPVAMATWYGGRRLGRWLSVLGALTWMLADDAAGHAYHLTLALYWNTGVRLAFFLLISVLLDRLRDALEHQRSLAEKDPLTGLLNARAFRRRCRPQFDLARRHGQSMAIAYLDLDGFKAVNDRLGHAEGDRVLQAVAATLSARMRLSDTACRMGGDEFVIALPQTDMDGARSFFTAFHQNLMDMAQARQWPVGFSIGVVVAPGAACDFEQAIAYADKLMYKVKQSGKNALLLEQFVPKDAPAPTTGKT